MSEPISQVEPGQHGPTSLRTSPDIPESSNTHNKGRQQRLFPLLTGYRLFTTIWILGLGIPKAVYSYRGQSLVPTTLDWVVGIIFGLISFWLGEIGAARPDLCPGFFEVDLAPYILKFLRRGDVLMWFASALPLLLAVGGISIMEDIKRKKAEFDVNSEDMAQLIKGGIIQLAFGILMAVFLFCLEGLRVLWPKGLEGRGRYAPRIFCLILTAHLVFMVIQFITSLDTFNSKLNFLKLVRCFVILRPYWWMGVWSPLRPSWNPLGRFDSISSRHFPFLKRIGPYISFALDVGAIVLVEFLREDFAAIGLDSSLFVCSASIYILRELSAIIPAPWVAWSYNSVCNAGTRVRAYVFDVYHRF